jgi:SpoVK/Ycf46/Vps4 family AAA+-type ATPase
MMPATKLGQIEQMLLDTTRVALTGDVEGVRMLARRAVRRLPSDAAHPQALKHALLDLLEKAPGNTDSPLRSNTMMEAPESSWIRHPTDVPQPVLSGAVAHTIRLLIAEHTDPAPLAHYGLTPSRAVLFTGPPGVGKTITAAYIASELELPLITVNLASLISSLMGKTGQNLQDVLTLASAQPCVVFFDEFDALAKSRGDSSDVGEVRRLVNVILQQLDRWPAGGLLIAATNHSQLLDPAVHRRFDTTIHFELPDAGERAQLLRASAPLAASATWATQIELLSLVTEGWSHADIESWVARSLRRAVLEGSGQDINVPSELLDDAKGTARRYIDKSPLRRAQLAAFASTHAGWSNRRIADWLGVTHPTISSDLKRSTTTASGE